jgi:hypothetical protein
MRSRWFGSMLAWILNTNPVKAGSVGCTMRTSVARGNGEGAQSTSARSTSRTPKLLMPEPKNTGDCCPLRNSCKSKDAPAPLTSSVSSRMVCISFGQSLASCSICAPCNTSTSCPALASPGKKRSTSSFNK